MDGTKRAGDRRREGEPRPSFCIQGGGVDR